MLNSTEATLAPAEEHPALVGVSVTLIVPVPSGFTVKVPDSVKLHTPPFLFSVNVPVTLLTPSLFSSPTPASGFPLLVFPLNLSE